MAVVKRERFELCVTKEFKVDLHALSRLTSSPAKLANTRERAISAPSLVLCSA